MSDDDGGECDYPDDDETYWSDDAASIRAYRRNRGRAFETAWRRADERYERRTREPQPDCSPQRRPVELKAPRPFELTDDCCICLASLADPVKVSYCASQCGRAFHTACIREFRPDKCPLCRIEDPVFAPMQPIPATRRLYK